MTGPQGSEPNPWQASGAEAKAGGCDVPTMARMVSEEGPPHACTRRRAKPTWSWSKA